MSTTITPTEQNIEINVNNDVIDINVTNEIVDVNATTQQIDINVAGAYPIPNPVLSVFGRTGAVVATEGDYTLTQLGDVTLSSPLNGQVLKYNGIAWVNGLDAGGITTLNTLTALSQTFATGTSGTDFNIASATATHTFNLPTASATNRGALSSADWTTFNNKQNTLTNPITGTGTSGQVAYFNGTSSLTSSATFAFTPTSQLLVNNSVTAASAIARGTNLTPTLTAAANNDVLVGLDIAPTFTNGAFTGVGNIGLRVRNSSLVIVGTNGTIALDQSNATSNYLYSLNPTSTAWRDFTIQTNGQNVLNVLSTGVVTIGTKTVAANTMLTINNNFGSGSTAIESTGNIFFKGCNYFFVEGTNRLQISTITSGQNEIASLGFGASGWRHLAFQTNGTTATLFTTGNLLIQNGGTHTDAGFRLDVNGTARIQGNTTVSLNQNASTSLEVINTTSGTSALTRLVVTSTLGSLAFGKFSTATTVYKNVSGNDGYIYLSGTGNISILNDFASGNINFAAGGSSTAQATLTAAGRLLLGTTTEGTFLLDVNGTARVQGQTIIKNAADAEHIKLENRSIDFSRNSGTSYGSSISSTGTAITLYARASMSFLVGGSGVTMLYLQEDVSGANTGTVRISPPIGLSSGTAPVTTLLLRPTNNFTGTYSGIVRGLLYDPINTSLTGVTHRAIETVSGDVLLGTTSGNVAIGTSTLATATELTLGGSQTASSAIARGGLINTTLVAAANNDVLVGLDINPTFTNGAFTGVGNIAARINGILAGVTRYDSTGTGGHYMEIVSTTSTNGYVNLRRGGGPNGLTAYQLSNHSGTASAAFSYNAASGETLLTTTEFLSFATGNTTGMQMFKTTRNVVIQNGGTFTDAGFRLDVNGTARVQGDTSVSGSVTATGNSNSAIIHSVGDSYNVRLAADRINFLGTGNSFSGLTIGSTFGFIGVNKSTFNSIPTGSILIGSGADKNVSFIDVQYNETFTVINQSSSSSVCRINGGYRTGTDLTANNFNIITPLGTGTGAGGDIITLIGVSGTTGTTRNTTAEIMRIKSSTANISIGANATPNASAILDITSTTKGVLFPRMTTTQKNAISSPATGLVVYDTTLNKLSVYTGAAWETVTSL